MHYKNGTPAKVGDQVVGKLYNTDGIVAGTLVSVTPGVDSCNCKVRFLALVPVRPETDEHPAGILDADVPRMAVRLADGVLPPFERVKTMHHGTDGAEVAVIACEDYSALNELLRADQVFEAGLIPTDLAKLNVENVLMGFAPKPDADLVPKSLEGAALTEHSSARLFDYGDLAEKETSKAVVLEEPIAVSTEPTA
jgi:hypothetical protein